MGYTFGIYICSFLISVMFAGLFYRENRRKIVTHLPQWLNTIIRCLIIVCVPMIISCYRYNIGIDYKTYAILFQDSINADLTGLFGLQGATHLEIGNVLLVKLVYFVFHNINAVFAAYAIITWLLFMLAIDYFSDRISVPIALLVLFLIYYSASFNTLRQILAAAIIAYSFQYIEKKKLILYALFILIATSFHSSALVAFVFYFLSYDRNEVKRTIIKNSFISKFAYRVAICLLLIMPFIWTYVIQTMGNMNLFGRYLSDYSSSSFNIVSWLFFRIPIYAILILNYKKLTINDGRMRYLFWVTLIDFEFLLMSTVYQWAFRLTYYTAFSQSVLLGFYVKNIDKKNTKAIFGIGIVAWFILEFWVYYFMWGWDAIVPYIHL